MYLQRHTLCSIETLFQFAIIDSLHRSKFAYVTAVVKTGGFSKFVLAFVFGDFE